MSQTSGPTDHSQLPSGWVAAREAYLRSGRLLTATLTTMLRSRENAQDAVQDALEALAVKLPTIKDHSPIALDAWLRRTAVNKAISSHRKTRRLLPCGSSIDIDEAWKQLASHLPPEDQAAAREALRFISRLSDKQRTTYLLRHYLGFTLAEIAKAMHCSEGNVSTHLQRAQARIDKNFARELSPAYQQIVTRLRGREDEA